MWWMWKKTVHILNQWMYLVTMSITPMSITINKMFTFVFSWKNVYNGFHVRLLRLLYTVPCTLWIMMVSCDSGRVSMVSRRSLALPTAPGMSLSLPLQCGPAHMLGMTRSLFLSQELYTPCLNKKTCYFYFLNNSIRQPNFGNFWQATLWRNLTWMMIV